jgi:hypothetical protein
MGKSKQAFSRKNPRLSGAKQMIDPQTPENSPDKWEFYKKLFEGERRI